MKIPIKYMKKYLYHIELNDFILPNKKPRTHLACTATPKSFMRFIIFMPFMFSFKIFRKQNTEN